MQLRIAAGQVERIGLGRHRLVGQRREEDDACAELLQQVDVGGVQEGEGVVAGDGHRAAGQTPRRGVDLDRRDEAHRRGQRRRGTRDHIGCAFQPALQVRQFGRLNQAQVARGPVQRLAARQRAECGHARRQALDDHARMALAADAVGDHAGEVQPRPVQLQPERDRAEGLRHRAGVDHRQHWQPEPLGQRRARGTAVMQAHHAFDEDQVGLASGLPEQLAAVILAAHPQVELPARRAAGVLVHHRIDEVGAGLEHPHPQALAAPVAGQRGRHRGLALAGGRRADQQRGAEAVGPPGRNIACRHACRPHAPCGCRERIAGGIGRGRTEQDRGRSCTGLRRSPVSSGRRPPRCQCACFRPVSGLASAGVALSGGPADRAAFPEPRLQWHRDLIFSR